MLTPLLRAARACQARGTDNPCGRDSKARGRSGADTGRHPSRKGVPAHRSRMVYMQGSTSEYPGHRRGPARERRLGEARGMAPGNRMPARTDSPTRTPRQSLQRAVWTINQGQWFAPTPHTGTSAYESDGRGDPSALTQLSAHAAGMSARQADANPRRGKR